MFEQYEHHGNLVWVDSVYKGMHREYCLCYQCKKFTPDNRATNCPIANAVYKNCVERHVVTPVWECPDFDKN